jgi:hypothetical protein
VFCASEEDFHPTKDVFYAVKDVFHPAKDVLVAPRTLASMPPASYDAPPGNDMRFKFPRLFTFVGTRQQIVQSRLIFLALWAVCGLICYLSLFELTRWPPWINVLLAVPGGALLLRVCIWMA